MAFTTVTTSLIGSAQQERNVLKYKTPKGKVIKIFVQEKGAPHYKVEFESGGLLPKELKGKFTSKRYAIKAVEAYLDRLKAIDEAEKDKKAEKKAPAKSKEAK